jgi:hypothetical protein
MLVTHAVQGAGKPLEPWATIASRPGHQPMVPGPPLNGPTIRLVIQPP